jgi:arginine decarboxylase
MRCDQTVPYPPGILVLVPGQRITDDIVEYLVPYLRMQNKVELHGVVCQGCVPSIRVPSAGDERRCVARAAARPSRRRSA